MNAELKNIGLALGLSAMAAGFSSCSLLGKGQYASQWEIQTEVPASLNSGRATTPSADAVAGPVVDSNLNGVSPAADGSLDLPVSADGSLMDIPKPAGVEPGLAYQSPPEMLNVPSPEHGHELPYTVGTPSGIESLLPAPPPAVTEEELNMDTALLSPGDAVPPATDLPLTPAESEAAGDPPAAESSADSPVETTAAAPSIPLLYGKLDLAPFLNPPGPLASAAPPEAASE